MIKADANRQRSVPGSEWSAPATANHAVPRISCRGLTMRRSVGQRRSCRKFISHADPAARWTEQTAARPSSPTAPTTDRPEARRDVDVEATTAVRQAEVTAQQRMIDRTQERFGLWPERLTADTAYGSAENLAWLVHERGIEPHIPVFDNLSAATAPSSRDDFTYDAQARLLHLPWPGRNSGSGKKSIECRPLSSIGTG